MSHEVITDPAQLTHAWLDAALTEAGALRSGGVAGFEAEGGEGSWSRSARLSLRYREGSAGDLPETLFLKLCAGESFGPSEVLYYTRDYVGLADAPIPRCYHAAYRESPPAYHLLLQDLSATHAATWDAPATPALAAAVADALATLHAHRWAPARLAEIGANLPGPAEIDRYLGHIRRGLDPLLAVGGGDLGDEWRARLREVFSRHPARMLERARDARGICLVHGDVNPGNILRPRGGEAPVYILDRQPFDWSLTVWLGASDLAYLLCTFWDEDVRRAHELPMLRAYHAGLLRRGVADYPWERLWDDYRLAAVQSLYVAVEWCVLEDDRERMRWLWTTQLRRAMAAFEDLGCAAIL